MPRPLTLTPAHLVRVGRGLDGIRVEARGFGLLIAFFGVRWVRGSLGGVFLRRFRQERCRALFVGLHGLAWASIALPRASLVEVPAIGSLEPPQLPSLQALPSLRVELTVTAPRPPVEEGLP